MVKYFRGIIITILIAFSFTLSAQPDAPVFLCASVNEDGTATLSWDVTGPVAGFERYEIYFSQSQTGPYNLAGTVTDFNTMTFDHTGIVINAQPYHYYLVTIAGGVPSGSSDTLRTMQLLLTLTNPELVELSWTPLSSVNPPGSSTDYEIYREYPPGQWDLIGTTPGLQYTDQFLFCNEGDDIVNYRIGLNNSSGCQSFSVIRGDLIFNYQPPPQTFLDSVSITQDGEIILGWPENPAPDLWGYVIYTVGTTNDSIDFVPGRNNTTYIDNTVDPCAASYSYAISAIDSCGRESPGSYDIPQRTLLLEEPDYDPCDIKNILSWNGYINFDPPLERYEVFVSEQGNPFTLLANIPPTETTYEHTGLNSNTIYDYFIRAVSEDGKSSSSCTRTIQTYDSPEPGYMYLANVTVTEEENVDLKFYTDTSAHVNSYIVMRSEDAAGPYSEIGVVSPTQEEVLYFTDQDADVQVSSYFYKISVVDSCQNEYEIANTSRSIFLSATANDDRTNDLEWNEYEFWEGGIDTYRVYRLIDGIVDNAFPVSGTTFTDDVSDLGGLGSISYYVEAEEGNGNPFGFKETSRSNEVRALQESLIFIPNAFRPQGFNNTFRPIMSFVDPDGYYFRVYNRWGQLIFETTNPNDSWDGKYNGDFVKQEVYVYLVRYRDSGGALQQQTGSVMVLF